MREHSGDELSDEALDRELETALAVEPSPEFLVRVRAAVAAEPGRTKMPWSWAFAGGAVLATIVALVMARGTIRSRNVDPQQTAEALPAPATILEAPRFASQPAVEADASTPTRRAVVRRAGPKAATTQPVDTEVVAAPTPEILISAQHAAIVRRLIALARGAVVVDARALPEQLPATVALRAPSDITLAPIEFAPIPAVALEEGERP